MPPLNQIQNTTPSTQNLPPQNTKSKVVLIVSIVLFVFVIIVLVWFLFFRTKNPTIVDNNPNINLPTGVDRGDNNNNNSSSTNINNTDQNNDDFNLRTLWHVWDKPVAGYGFSYDVAEGDKPNVLFVDKGTGNIYKSFFDKEKQEFTNTKISNITFTNVISSIFSVGGDYVVINYKDNKNINQSYIAKVPRTENTESLDGSIIGQNIKNIVASPSASNFAYIKSSATGGSINIYNTKTDTETTLANFPVSEFKLNWVSEENIIISTKPSNTATQQNFILNTKTKKMSNFVSNPGSINISPNGKSYIVSDGLNIKYYAFAYDNGINLSTRSVSDKCVWLKENVICANDVINHGEFTYPDAWYKGLISFRDTLNSIDVTNNKEVKISSLDEVSTDPIDVYLPKISTDYNILNFENKIDGSLWVLDVVNTVSL